MPLEKASELATECWRLCKWTKASNTFGTDRQVLDRVARRLNEILNTIGVRTIDLAGTAYDPGIVSEVLDVQIDSTLPRGTSLIDETVLPRLLPLWNDKVIQIGQIIVRQAPTRSEIFGEMGMMGTIDYGIDLGTTNSCIAKFESGSVRAFQNNDQMNVTPFLQFTFSRRVASLSDAVQDRRCRQILITFRWNLRRWMAQKDRKNFPAAQRVLSAEELSAECSSH